MIVIAWWDQAPWQLSHTALIQPAGASLRVLRCPDAPQNSQTVADCSSAAVTRARVSARAGTVVPVIRIRAAPSFSLRSST